MIGKTIPANWMSLTSADNQRNREGPIKKKEIKKKKP